MEKLPEIGVFDLGVVLFDDTAVHKEKIKHHFKRTSQKGGNIVCVQEEQGQRALTKGIKFRVHPLVAVDHTQLRRQAGQGAGNNIFHLPGQSRFRCFGVIAADRVLKAEYAAAGAFQTLCHENGLALALQLLFIPVCHLDLVEMQRQIEAAVAVLHGIYGFGVVGQIAQLAVEGLFQYPVPFPAKVRVIFPVSYGVVLIHGFNSLKDFLLVSVLAHLQAP